MSTALSLTDEIKLDSSWIDGQHSCGWINTRIPWVEVYAEEFFCQGHDAELIIQQITDIYANSELTAEQAFQVWIAQNF